MVPALILSSDSHVFEPPDLWRTRIDAAFRDRAPRMQRIDGADQLVVEADQVISGIGLISNAGARFEAPETISGQGRFEDVPRGGYDPDQHLRDMELDGVAGEVLYPSQGLFYFWVTDTPLMSAIFRAYNDWLADFCSTDRSRLKGIAMINLDDVQDGIRELERAAHRGLAGAMITEYPLEHRRYDQPEYEPLWAAAEALAMHLSLHTATRRQGRIRGAGEKTLRDASSRATKAFYPALSMCDMIFSGVFERHPGLTLAIVEFELAWAPHVLSTMDYTYRERHGEAIYRFKDGMRPSDFFRRNVVLSFQEDAIGIRLRDTIGVDSMMWGSDYPHSESTFPRSRKILAEILAGVPEDEQAKIVGGNTARLYHFDVARLLAHAEETTSLRIDDPGVRALFSGPSRCSPTSRATPIASPSPTTGWSPSATGRCPSDGRTAPTATPLGSPRWMRTPFCAASCSTFLPARFVQIRHYGWLANSARTRLLPSVRQALGPPAAAAPLASGHRG